MVKGGILERVHCVWCEEAYSCRHRFPLDQGLLFHNLRIEGHVEESEADLLPLGGILGAVGAG
jgi:hypothetical protein